MKGIIRANTNRSKAHPTNRWFSRVNADFINKTIRQNLFWNAHAHPPTVIRHTLSEDD
jgi:hypothetical protein